MKSKLISWEELSPYTQKSLEKACIWTIAHLRGYLDGKLENLRDFGVSKRARQEIKSKLLEV